MESHLHIAIIQNRSEAAAASSSMEMFRCKALSTSVAVLLIGRICLQVLGGEGVWL